MAKKKTEQKIDWTIERVEFRNILVKMVTLVVNRYMFELNTSLNRRKIVSFINGYCRLFKNLGIIASHETTIATSMDNAIEIVVTVQYAKTDVKPVLYTWRVMTNSKIVAVKPVISSEKKGIH